MPTGHFSKKVLGNSTMTNKHQEKAMAEFATGAGAEIARRFSEGLKSEQGTKLMTSVTENLKKNPGAARLGVAAVAGAAAAAPAVAVAALAAGGAYAIFKGLKRLSE